MCEPRGDPSSCVAPLPVTQFPHLETFTYGKAQPEAVICLSWVWGHWGPQGMSQAYFPPLQWHFCPLHLNLPEVLATCRVSTSLG